MTLTLTLAVLLQTSALLSIFDTEITRAQVPQYRSLFAAQIQQESAWRPNAESPYAQGLTQFTPPTRGDIYPQTRPSCEFASPYDPACSVRAQILYMTRFIKNYAWAATMRDRQAFALAAYNGGGGKWFKMERRKCRQDSRCSPSRWWGNVADKCVRATWACKENREYPDRIFRYEPRYRR